MDMARRVAKEEGILAGISSELQYTQQSKSKRTR